MNNNLHDTIELKDLIKGYVVIKDNDRTLIEGFNTIVNDGRSFILSKIAANAFATALEPVVTNENLQSLASYTFSKIYFCEAANGTSTAKATEVADTLETYSAFIPKDSSGAILSDYCKSITNTQTKYDLEKRELVFQYDLTTDYRVETNRVISSVLLTISDGTHEKLFSRFTFDPKVISGNATIQIYYHIHF